MESPFADSILHVEKLAPRHHSGTPNPCGISMCPINPRNVLVYRWVDPGCYLYTDRFHQKGFTNNSNCLDSSRFYRWV